MTYPDSFDSLSKPSPSTIRAATVGISPANTVSSIIQSLQNLEYRLGLSPSEVTYTADATTDTLTSNSHGLANADVLVVKTTGTVPGGLAVDTPYFVIGATANTFQLAATRAGAAIDITSNGTATNSFIALFSEGKVLLSSTGSTRSSWSNAIDLTAGSLVLPQSASIAPTAEGSVGWDTDDNLLKIGTGAGTKTLFDTDSTQTGTNKTFTSPLLNTPKIGTSLNDTSANEVIKTPATASAVNEITVTNAAAGSAPSIAATGDDSAIHLNLRGKGLAKSVTIGNGAALIYPYDYVVSGCVWTADAAGSTRVASMTAGVVVINGNPLVVAAVTSRTFTASKDVYVDILDNGDGTGVPVYTDGTTNAASGALAANSIRLAIVVVGATSIAAAASINQGQEDRILPIASSIPYAVTDSLGNLICPRDPQRRILGYRQITSDFTTSSATAVQVTGLTCPVIVPTARKVKITVYGYRMFQPTANTAVELSIWDGVVASGTQLELSSATSDLANAQRAAQAVILNTPASASKTFNAGLRNVGGGTVNLSGGATSPAFIMVELV